MNTNACNKSYAAARKKLLVATIALVAATNALRGQAVPDGFNPNVNEGVYAIVVQPDGKILIGGNFSAVAPNGGTPVTRNNIARLNPDGTLDLAFNPNANNPVYAIALQTDGSIVVGGEFSDLSGTPTIGGATRNNIARLDPVTGAADSFNPNANQGVYAVAVQADGKILAGGNFWGATSIGGQPRNRIARLDPVTGAADSFDPNATFSVDAIALQADGKILVGGVFASIGGQLRSKIARLDPVTGAADSFNPNAENYVRTIVVQPDGKILVGGDFQSIGGLPRGRIARLDPTTGLADSFDPSASGGAFSVYTIAVQADGRVLLGGYFTTLAPNGGAPVTRNRIARVNPDGSLDAAFDPNVNRQVGVIALQADGKILLGGDFTTLAPNEGPIIQRNHIARLENDAPVVVKTYPANSLIIPMDLTYQDSGAFRAYGLVHKLLAAGVRVDWTIRHDKLSGAADFTVSALDFRNGTSITNHPYRGGPFVIHQADRAAADPIVQTWLTNNVQTNVHIATAPFTADVERALIDTPRIAVLDDGNAAIPFSYLNAAGIPDAQGNIWSAASPDVLSPAAVAGPTSTNHRDGALFDAIGIPRVSVLVSGHQNAVGVNLEAIAETGQFLLAPTLLIAECQSIHAFEDNGHFLTNQGITTMAQPGAVDHFFNDQGIAHDDGLWQTVGGSDPSFLPTGSYSGSFGIDYFRVVREQSAPSSDVVVFGRAFQNPVGGRVLYLAGHQYGVSTPLSANPTGHGTRTFLNGVLTAPPAGLAQLARAVSRKTHATAGRCDILLPQTGVPVIECRSGGAGNDHQIVATFVEAVTFGGASVSAGSGAVSSTTGNGTNVVTINLTGVTNAQRLTVILSDVSEGGPSSNIPITMGVLLGDTNGGCVGRGAAPRRNRNRFHPGLRLDHPRQCAGQRG
ncbi:MAG: delta-60 repeat domain-containing protein, partial [Chthoniobacterales bacterium]